MEVSLRDWEKPSPEPYWGAPAGGVGWGGVGAGQGRRCLLTAPSLPGASMVMQQMAQHPACLFSRAASLVQSSPIRILTSTRGRAVFVRSQRAFPLPKSHAAEPMVSGALLAPGAAEAPCRRVTQSPLSVTPQGCLVGMSLHAAGHPHLPSRPLKHRGIRAR